MSFVDFRYFGEADQLHFSWHLLANFLKPTYARESGQDGCRHSTVLGPAVAVSAASRARSAGGRASAARANSAAIACHRRARRSIGWSPSRTSTAATSVIARACSRKAQVSAGLVMLSAVPWASRTRRPASWPAGSDRGARPHGVPDQHDRHGPELGLDRVERIVQVADR